MSLKTCRAAAVLVTLTCHDLAAIPPALPDVVPADGIAAYFVAGPPRAQDRSGPRSAVELAAFLADQAYRLGLLSRMDTGARAWIDALSAAAVVLQYPHAVVLLDVQAKRRADGGHELARAKAALIALTRGGNRIIEQRIQHLLNIYANSERSTLSQRRMAGTLVSTIRDRRLPSWASLSFGPIGDYYVVAIGEGTYDRIAGTLLSGTDRSATLSGDPWFAGAFPNARRAATLLAAYVRFDRLSAQVDPKLARKIDGVLAALGLGHVERALWTQEMSGRSVDVSVTLRRNGQDQVRVIAGGAPFFAQRRAGKDRPPPSRFRLERVQSAERTGHPRNERTALIPEQAGGYAVIDAQPLSVFRRVREAYLVAKSPRAQEKQRAFWRDFEAAAGVSMERDILTRLSGPVAVHNYPRHALNLPLAWTVVVPIQGDPAALRSYVDAYLRAASERLPHGGTLQLHHDADGVWYVQYGITGPALTVTDRCVILSFSPQAVRQNVVLLLTEDITP